MGSRKELDPLQEKSGALMPPQERGVSFLRAWSPYRRNDEWVKEAEDLELSPLLLLAWSSVPHRAPPLYLFQFFDCFNCLILLQYFQ